MQPQPSPRCESIEKPQNGLAGLKHWRYDMRSGFLVAMISLPFSMGIAITSGAPPVCGILSAIIAGFILPFLGGSYVTISGPAAGLAPAVFAGMMTLGAAMLGSGATQAEKLATGYPLILVAICIAGALQMVLAKFKVARLSAIFPAAVIEGMLAAIGLMIIVKQIPYFMGQSFEAHEFWEILGEIPSRLAGMDPAILGLSIGCIAALFILNALPGKLLKVMPPPVWVFVGGTAVSYFILHLDSKFLINVPGNLLEHGIVFPKFQEVFTNPVLWLPMAYIVVTLMLIDGTESLATIVGVDKIDPFHRRSDPDRTLLSMGASNIASSVLGGLTIIPGIVKSTTNIIGGGRTQWANFYNACCLLVFLIFAQPLINLVPLAVLGSILLFVGFKLCRPKVWRHVAHIGTEQILLFTVTVVVTVSTDLLLGVATGVALKLVLNLWYMGLSRTLSDCPQPAGLPTRLADLFRNPVCQRDYRNGVYRLHIQRSLVCFNLFHVIQELERIPTDAREVQLHLGPDVTLVDHTTSETIIHYAEEYSSRPTKLPMELIGWKHLRPLSTHPCSVRLAVSSGPNRGSNGYQPASESAVPLPGENLRMDQGHSLGLNDHSLHSEDRPRRPAEVMDDLSMRFKGSKQTGQRPDRLI